MFKNFKFYEPNDGAEKGDLDESKDKPVDPMAAVKAVADQIATSIAALKQQPVQVVMPKAQDDPRAALAAEALTMNEKYNALCADGDYAGAAVLRDNFVARANAVGQGDPNDNPVVKTAVGLGKKHAKLDHKDIMAKYGDEVERVVNSLPVEKRILPDAWDRAVSEVKTNHFDELMAEVRTQATEEANKGFVTSGSQPGSRGRKADSDFGLDEIDKAAAEVCGVSPEAFSKRLKAAEDWDKLPFRERGADGYPVVSQVVKPGRF